MCNVQEGRLYGEVVSRYKPLRLSCWLHSVISVLEHFQPGFSPYCLFLFNLVSGERYVLHQYTQAGGVEACPLSLGLATESGTFHH